MTEEPIKQPEEAQPEKLMLDDPSNFPFHAAYLAYSDVFDQATSAEVKKELNGHIEALKEGKIDFETFYRNIAHHRKIDMPRMDRFSLQTQRKKDWRAKEQRSDRIKRHKK